MAEDEVSSPDDVPEVPAHVVEEAERLTRLASDAVDENEADAYHDRRAALLSEHGFAARVREEPAGGETLVLYPEEWLTADGVVDLDAVDDTDRAHEIRLSGRGGQGDWADAETTNRALVEQIRDEYADVHAANAAAFADFMGNHYARPMTDATEAELREFLEEYFPRNAWPTPDQVDAVEQSLAIVFAEAEERFPLD